MGEFTNINIYKTKVPENILIANADFYNDDRYLDENLGFQYQNNNLGFQYQNNNKVKTLNCLILTENMVNTNTNNTDYYKNYVCSILITSENNFSNYRTQSQFSKLFSVPDNDKNKNDLYSYSNCASRKVKYEILINDKSNTFECISPPPNHLHIYKDNYHYYGFYKNQESLDKIIITFLVSKEIDTFYKFDKKIQELFSLTKENIIF